MSAELSIVVLCYKAGKDIVPFVDRLRKAITHVVPNWEMILVGNYNQGDTQDETPAIVRSLAQDDPRIKAITMVKQGWMGWDARTGLAAATGKNIALIDGDNQMPPEDVLRVYQKLLEGSYDAVTTYRIQRGDGIARRVQSLGYNAIFAALFPGTGLKDVNAKPKIIRRAMFDKLHLSADDWFLDAEIAIQLRRHKARIGQIPTVFLTSNGRDSFVRINAVWEFVVNLAKARLREFGARQ